ncbi:hypothetical protein GUG97_22590, partial [Xanthomonas citri pv. citri]|nr:hypothetical protein [Xanthomonas citri pv. citri]
LIAERGLKLAADEANNSKGRIVAKDELRAKLGALVQNGGELTTQGALALDADKVDNGAGRIAGHRGVVIDVRQVDNRAGEIASQGVATLNL